MNSTKQRSSHQVAVAATVGLCAVTLLIVPGCGRDDLTTRYANVRAGMYQKEVDRMMGPPAVREVSPDNRFVNEAWSEPEGEIDVRFCYYTGEAPIYGPGSTSDYRVVNKGFFPNSRQPPER